MNQSRTKIYHITHVQNLPEILKTGGLLCDKAVSQRSLMRQGIAHNNIKERRARTRVHVASGGTLADYVPFYFTYRSPMLYTINKGNVASFQNGQSEIIYLVSDLEIVASSTLVWCFTDGHAAEHLTFFFENPTDLAKIDWGVIGSTSWGNTLADPDRKRKKQAEVLVHQQFPWSSISSIGVFDAAMQSTVQGYLASATHKPVVSVQKSWYY